MRAIDALAYAVGGALAYGVARATFAKDGIVQRRRKRETE